MPAIEKFFSKKGCYKDSALLKQVKKLRME